MGRTLAEKVWDEHVVRSAPGEPDLLYIDLHLIHELSSAQAFDGLRSAGRRVRRPELTLATEDHNVPTLDWDQPIADPVSRTHEDVRDIIVTHHHFDHVGGLDYFPNAATGASGSSRASPTCCPATSSSTATAISDPPLVRFDQRHQRRQHRRLGLLGPLAASTGARTRPSGSGSSPASNSATPRRTVVSNIPTTWVAARTPPSAAAARSGAAATPRTGGPSGPRPPAQSPYRTNEPSWVRERLRFRPPRPVGRWCHYT